MFTNNFTSKISRLQDGIFLFLAIGLIIYTSSRAHLLSMTCDEASTFFSHVPRSVWTCFFSESCWSDANNHLLNTWLMQISISAFGVSEWSLRLPNLFGHLLYLLFSILLVRRCSKNLWIALAGFCLLNLNPYLLEFFSLARGYGLGIGWMMMSIYFLLRWVERGKLKLQMYCYGAAVLAVLSNFVFLNYWASLSAVFLLFGLFSFLEQKASDGKERKKRLTQNILWTSSTALLLFILLKNPIHFLRSKGEFVYGKDSFVESYEEMVKLSLMAQGYFNPYTTKVFMGVALILLSTSVFFGLRFLWIKNKNIFVKIHFATTLLLLVVLCGLMVQFHFLGIKYLEGRKAIMLISLFGLNVYTLLETWNREFGKKGIIGFAILITAFSVNHFYRTFDLKESVEWSYDAYTKDMIRYVEANAEPHQKVKLGVFWKFAPASEFYHTHLSVTRIDQIVRLDIKDLEAAPDFDLIYLEKYQVEFLKGNYVLEKAFGDSGLLFRKDEKLVD